ncbi:MAG TPA: hypothetical protein VJM10_03780 [Candidatus Methylomirabilis sp.]|nr:hypothetical protein [Candidatus Methylomirabilis sp.]
MPPISAFARRFPEVQDVILEWGENLASGEASPEGVHTFSHSTRAADGTLEPALGCPNSRCRGGGFEIEFLMESMVSERLEEKSGLLVCLGWERQQRSKTERIPCTAAIRYRIRVSYRKPVVRTTPTETNGKAGAS